MFVENKEMYHFNNNEKHNDIWKIGNEFDNNKDYISDFYNGALNFCANVPTNPDDEMVHFSCIIDNYLKEEQDKETYIRMLKEASIFLKGYATTQREMVLEQVRKELYPNLISRKKAIWLCDNKQINFWKDSLGKTSDLFKVSITGDLFKTSDEFIPDKDMNILQMYEAAKKYWNPTLENINESRIEYLFKGKVKVLEKI